jgi:toxin ParE1/3/4
LRIQWTRTAAASLEAIGRYIEVDDPAAAARVVIHVIDAIERLAEHPALGRAGRVPGTRELIVPGTPYLVPYRIEGSVVQVLRVLHGAMRWPDAP